MALNGEQANNSSASNKSVKKMKKRKELDALLTGANGKAKHFNKPNNKPPKKDGHELLIPDESDSIESSDNDFFASPKKAIIRKPRPWRICATCIPLCIFVLTLACIVVTTGLIWMHMDLKEDLDDLRERLAKVESDVQTSQAQAATVSSLESKLEKLQGLIIKNQQTLTQIKSLNQSINDLRTQVKAIKSSQTNTAASNELQLQQDVANMGAKLNELEEMAGTVKELQEHMTEVTGNVETLEGTVSELEKLAEVVPTSSQRSQVFSQQPTGEEPVYTELSVFVHKNLERIGLSLDNINSTINDVRQSQQGLDARLTLLELIGVGKPQHSDSAATITPEFMSVFTQLHGDVNTLMHWYNETQLHSTNDSRKFAVSSPFAQSPGASETLSIDDDASWQHFVNHTLLDIQNKMELLSSKAIPDTLQNPNAASALEKSLAEFRNTSRREMDDVQRDQRSIWEEIGTLRSNMQGVQKHFASVYDRLEHIQGQLNDTERVKHTKPPVELYTTPKLLSPIKSLQNTGIPPTSPSPSSASMHDTTVESTIWDSETPVLATDEMVTEYDTSADDLEVPSPSLDFSGIDTLKDLQDKFSV